MTTIKSPYGIHLPIFPLLSYDRPTEAQIERAVERLVDRADAVLMAGNATQAQYDAWFARLNQWASEQAGS